MAKAVTYLLSGSQERRSSDVAEMQRIVQRLIIPNTSLITNPDGCDGYLDFVALDDGLIEMEIFESNDDFATIDIPTATRVMEIAMTDTRDIPLREKLKELQINWLT